jgi:L-alanine-DL-glutamate epimerase-like enolase superfamily enzyme
MATKGTRRRKGSLIERIELHQFAYTVENIAIDASGNRVPARGASSRLEGFVVVVITRDGARGEFCPGHSGKTGLMVEQVRALARQVLGEDAEAREAIFNHLKRVHRWFGAIGHSAIDICLWDLVGKRLDRPVWRLLGGYRERLPAYASTLHGGRDGILDSKEAYAEFALACHEQGFRAFKIHGWGKGDPREEAENILHCRKEVGDRLVLIYDGGSELATFADAVHVGRACDEAGVLWLEDPHLDAGWSPHAACKLRQLIRTPLLMTENVRGLEPKTAWLTMQATDLLRADPEYDMGITGAMKTAHLAEAFGVDCELHAAGVAQRHCMAALRNSNYYELSLVAPGVVNPIPPVFLNYSDALEDVGADGCYPVPDGAGLGVDLDWKYIEQHRTARQVFGS